MTELWAIAGVPVQLKRSARRRTVALQVRPGEVTLYAPARMPLANLRRLLEDREAWVARHLARYAAQPRAALRFEDGALLPFLGQTLSLRFAPELDLPRRRGDDLWLPPGPPDATRQRVEDWTRGACLEAYRPLVEAWARRLGALDRLGRVQVTAARHRWGSCSAGGDIRLHWKLSRAPLDVLDYVALHEAAHLLELNHSPRYWALVEAQLPGFRARRDWLRDHGSAL